MTRRTVIHVIESVGPGGAESVFVDLVTRVDPSTYRSVAVVPSETGWLASALKGSEVRFASPTAWPDTKPFDIAYAKSLNRAFRELDPDIVHAHSFGSAIYCALMLVGRRARLITTLHGRVDVEQPGRLASVKWLLLRRAAAVVCVSDSLRSFALDARGAKELRLERIYNGIDLSRHAPGHQHALRNRLGLSGPTVLAGAAGNVRPPKGYADLLRAVAIARSRGVDIHLAIAGENSPSPLVHDLVRLRAELGLDSHVTFLGFLDDIGPFLNGLDVFVLSSETEGFSLSTVQALASGLPVICTKCGGPEEIVEAGVSGLMVPVRDPDSLADALATLATDSELRGRLALAARARSLNEFSIEGMLRRYEALYQRVLNRS